MLKTIVEGCEPQRASKYSAFIDLFASEDVTISAGETKIVGLGVCLDLGLLEDEPIFRVDLVGLNLGFIEGEFSEELFNEFLESHYLQLEPRSSLRAKGLIVGTGVIDLDYKDEIKLIVHNPVAGVHLMPIQSDDCSLIGEECICDGVGYEDFGTFRISKGDKIAQIALMEHKSYLMGASSEAERTGGIGSSGN